MTTRRLNKFLPQRTVVLPSHFLSRCFWVVVRWGLLFFFKQTRGLQAFFLCPMLTSFSLTHKPAPFPTGEGGVPGPPHFSSSPAAGRTDGRRQSHPQPDWKPTRPREPRPSRPTTPWRWRKGRGFPPALAALPHRPPAGCPRQKEALGGWGQRALEAANTSSGGSGTTELAVYRWERDAPRPRHAAAGRARPRKKGAHLLPWPSLRPAPPLTRRRAAARPAPEESREAPCPRAGEGRLGVASGRSGRSLRPRTRCEASALPAGNSAL